ncbi:MAG TPA: TolC family protein [Pelomicrobium sp.]|nr:TolC family protein [Pelomicrobium sp.]
MVRKLMAALVLAAALASPAAAAPGATVEELLDWLERASPELAAMRHEAAAAEARVDPAGAFDDPAFRIELRDIAGDASSPSTFNLSPARVGSTKYTVEQMIPLWGKRELRREIAAAAAAAADGQRRTVTVELREQVKSAFARHYQVRRAAVLTRDILELLRSLEQSVAARYATGRVPQQDVIKSQLEQTAMTSDLIGLEAESRQSAARLNGLLNRPGDAPLAEPRKLRPVPGSAVLEPGLLEQRIRDANPLLFAQASQVQAAERNRDLVRQNRYPDLSIAVSPIQEGNRLANWDVMFGISIPLQQDRRRAEEREAAEMLAAAHARREATSARLLGELRQAQAALEAARRQESLIAASLLPQARLTYEAALAGYETGRVDFATLLDAQRQILRAQLDELKAQVEQQVRLAEIERLVGGEL